MKQIIKYDPKDIDKRSLALIDEFHEHFAECKEGNPDMDQRVCFEGWAIQKIAGLHNMVTQLAEKIHELV